MKLFFFVKWDCLFVCHSGSGQKILLAEQIVNGGERFWSGDRVTGDAVLEFSHEVDR